MRNMKWIIIDTVTNKPLYGLNLITLMFDSEIEADNLAKQLIRDNNWLIVPITLPSP